MRLRMITPRNIVLTSILMFVVGLVWVILHCLRGTSESQEFREQIYSTNLKSLKEREALVNKKEQYIKVVLGIRSTKYPLSEQIPVIYIVTPTYARLTQKAEITRLYQTLLNVPQIHWIIVEDSEEKSNLIARFLRECIIPHTHLNVRTRNELIRGEREPRWLKNRGVDQRNLAMQWIRNHVSPNKDAVVYFADDDNTYHLTIFEMMRYTKKVSVWPVGVVGGLMWEGPICKNGKVVQFRTDFAPERPLPVDMAGFAINVKLLINNPDVEMDVYAKRGYVESSIVEQLVRTEELEALANNCKQILVWHTQTMTPKIKREKKLKKKLKGSDPSMEV